MFRLYSKRCEYALRALLHVLTAGDSARFQAKEVCAGAGIPESYSRKVFQALAQGGFLNTARGPGGGYTLSRRPEDISLLEVIQTVDGEHTFDHCIMGLPQCDDSKPCPVHEVWSRTLAQMLEQLGSRTLKDLAAVANHAVPETESNADSRWDNAGNR